MYGWWVGGVRRLDARDEMDWTHNQAHARRGKRSLFMASMASFKRAVAVEAFPAGGGGERHLEGERGRRGVVGGGGSGGVDCCDLSNRCVHETIVHSDRSGDVGPSPRGHLFFLSFLPSSLSFDHEKSSCLRDDR